LESKIYVFLKYSPFRSLSFGKINESSGLFTTKLLSLVTAAVSWLFKSSNQLDFDELSISK